MERSRVDAAWRGKVEVRVHHGEPRHRIVEHLER